MEEKKVDYSIWYPLTSLLIFFDENVAFKKPI
jgi:hypothetical protein